MQIYILCRIMYYLCIVHSSVISDIHIKVGWKRNILFILV
jgi:hypothetical protein